MCMYVYVCVHMCVFVYMRVCTTFACVPMCVLCAFVCMLVFVRACAYAYLSLVKRNCTRTVQKG